MPEEVVVQPNSADMSDFSDIEEDLGEATDVIRFEDNNEPSAAADDFQDLRNQVRINSCFHTCLFIFIFYIRSIISGFSERITWLG